jgi:hypothetical protein
MSKRAVWIQPVRGARRALDSVELLIGDVRKALHVSNRFGTARPIRALQGFDRAGSRLVKASERLGRAVHNLKVAVAVLDANPWDGAGAPAALLRTTDRLIDLGLKLYQVSERLSRTSDLLIEAAQQVGNGGPPPPPSRPTPPRRFLRHSPEPIVLKRRERPPPPAPEDAPRQLSRGRAPPSFDLPALSTAVSNERRNTMASHTEAAQALIEAIRNMRATIPNFVIPATAADRVRFNSAASVPADFIESSVVAVKNNPVLVRGGADSDPDTVRDLLNFAEAYDPVADELGALMKFIRHSTKTARGRAGSEALLTYAVTQRLAKRPATADLVPVRDALQRTLRAKRQKPQPPAPNTPPTPPSTPEHPANGS